MAVEKAGQTSSAGIFDIRTGTPVRAGTRNRRISIYSIGIAPGLPGSSLELFMKTLAEQNFGQFRRVDQ